MSDNTSTQEEYVTHLSGALVSVRRATTVPRTQLYVGRRSALRHDLLLTLKAVPPPEQNGQEMLVHGVIVRPRPEDFKRVKDMISSVAREAGWNAGETDNGKRKQTATVRAVINPETKEQEYEIYRLG